MIFLSVDERVARTESETRLPQIRTIEQIAEDPYLDLYRLTAPINFVIAISPS